jgi:hypothetical protein
MTEFAVVVGLPALAAATLAYVLLRDQSEALRMAGAVFTAGLLTVAAVEDMMTEACQRRGHTGLGSRLHRRLRPVHPRLGRPRRVRRARGAQPRSRWFSGSKRGAAPTTAGCRTLLPRASAKRSETGEELARDGGRFVA